MSKLFFIIFCLPIFAIGQTASESMKIANEKLDFQIDSIIAGYERDGFDFIIMRTYDTIPNSSRCRFVIRKDSCTDLFALDVSYNYMVSYISVGRVDRLSRTSQNPCYDEMTKIEKDLSQFTNYFKIEQPTEIDFKQHQYTVYGKINGRFIYETFEEDFISSFHSAMLYQTVCNYLGGWCHD
jgi:hypothetical protein